MTDYDAILRGATVGIFVGILIRVGYDWIMSGRVKKGEYYMTIDACQDCREKCCVHPVKLALGDLRTTLNTHISKEFGNDSEVNIRLASIEAAQKDAREDSAKLRADVAGIRSALDQMAGAFSVYVKRLDTRDRRTDDLQRGEST